MESEDQSQVMAEDIQKTEDENKVLAASILSKTKRLPSSSCCIFKVPEKLRTVKEEAYVPEVVSIGPYHRGKPFLQAMEDRKHIYLQTLLCHIYNISSSSSPSSSSSSENSKSSLLEELIKSMRELETQARECYEEIINLSSDEFVEMMLLDGCFILESLNRTFKRRPNYSKIDPAWTLLSVQRDLVLLENQIPFFVLEKIYSFSLISKDETEDLSCNILHFFAAKLGTIQATVYVRPTLVGKKSVPKLNQFRIQNPKHILDLIHSYLSPSPQKEKVEEEEHFKDVEEGDVTAHCVTDLWEAGVIFKRKEQDYPLLDIQFNSKHGIFEIPPFPFHVSTVVLLRNLVAMEQCHRDLPQPVSSYVVLLDTFIKSDKDVRLLRHKRIIENHLRNDEEMAATINSLCQGVIIISNFRHGELYHRCNNYLKTRGYKLNVMLKRDQFTIKCQEWKAMLNRDYFNSPWAVLSFIAAVLLLIFTFLQAFYAIRSYYSPSSSPSPSSS